MILCQLYSIPEPTKQGLVATEYVFGVLRGGEKEVPMDNKLRKTAHDVRNWINKRHIVFVCLLAVVHIGLSCIQTRDSGTADTRINEHNPAMLAPR